VVEAEEGKFLIGLCYRNTSSNASNDESLLKLLQKTADKRGISHFMIMGDINFPDIDYQHSMVRAGPNTAASRFFEETLDLFLVQHVHAATRYRVEQ